MKSLFFYFLVSSNTLHLQQQKSLFLTASDSFQHNTFHLQNSSQYLFNKHCTENNLMHRKAINNKETEKGGKNSMFLSHFISFLAWIIGTLPFLPFSDSHWNRLPNTKVRTSLIPFLEGKSPSWCRSCWSSWIYCRWSKLFKRALLQAKCSLNARLNRWEELPEEKDFFLFQSNSTLGQINTKANKSQALIRSWELFFSLTYTHSSHQTFKFLGHTSTETYITLHFQLRMHKTIVHTKEK